MAVVVVIARWRHPDVIATPRKIMGSHDNSGLAAGAMSFFNRPHYTSDITQFIDGLKAARPTLEAEQLAARAIWWDKKVDRSAQEDFAEGSIAQRPYVYQTNDS